MLTPVSARSRSDWASRSAYSGGVMATQLILPRRSSWRV
jgi:hypothetical protein